MPELDDRLLEARLAEAAEAEENENFFVKAYDYLSGKESEGYPELGTSGPSVPAITRGPSPFGEQEPGAFGEAPPTPFDPSKGQLQFNPPSSRMAAAYATQVDPQAIADIAEKALSGVDPDVKKGKDKYGNPTITFEGQTYYVNAPGVSTADAFQLLGQIGAFAPAAKSGAAAKTLFGRMMKTGFLSATTSVGLDVAGQAMGSEQDVDWWRAGLTGVLGGALEGLAPAVKYGWRTFFSKGPQYFDEATGKLTQEGIRIAREAGLDPVDMDRRLAQAFARQVVDEPKPAMAVTRAYQEAYDIPYTHGQQAARAGDFRPAAAEEAMREGTRGARAEAGMQALDKRFGEQAGKAMDVATGRAVRPIQETGEEVLTGVQAAEAAKRAARKAAYEAAEPYITKARITRENFSGLMRNVKQGIKDLGIDAEAHKKTVHTLTRLGRMFKKTRKADRLNITEVTLKRIETERKLINTALRGKLENTDRNALLEVQRAMDNWLQTAYDDALMSGDRQALNVLLKARKEAHEYFSLFTKQKGRKVPDEVGGVIEKILYADATPEQTINYVFGAGKLGRKQLSANVVKRIKSIVGEGSDEWTTLKDAAWRKMKTSSEGRLDDPLAFVKNFDDLHNNNKTLLDRLYTPDEIKVMKGVRDAIEAMDVGASAAKRHKAGIIMRSVQFYLHYRGTARAVLHKQPLFGGFLHAIGRNLPVVGDIIQEGGVKRAARQIPAPLPSLPTGVATGIAGTRTGVE